MQIEWGKLLVLLSAIVFAGLCLLTSTISESAGVGIITTCIGYTFGNGRLASRGQEPVPMLRAKRPEDN